MTKKKKNLIFKKIVKTGENWAIMAAPWWHLFASWLCVSATMWRSEHYIGNSCVRTWAMREAGGVHAHISIVYDKQRSSCICLSCILKCLLIFKTIHRVFQKYLFCMSNLLAVYFKTVHHVFKKYSFDMERNVHRLLQICSSCISILFIMYLKSVHHALENFWINNRKRKKEIKK